MTLTLPPGWTAPASDGHAMTAAEMILDLKAKRAASRQYADASERHAQRAVATFQAGKRDDARALAHLANDLRLWGRAECE